MIRGELCASSKRVQEFLKKEASSLHFILYRFWEANALLKYLYEVVEDLLPVVILATLLFKVNERLYGTWGRRSQCVGICLSLIASGVMVAVRQTTSILTKTASNWNFYCYCSVMAFALLYLICSLVSTRFGKRLPRMDGKQTLLSDRAACVAGACLSALFIFSRCREDFRKPFIFNTMGKGVISSDYLVRLLGFVIALLLLLLLSVLLAKCVKNHRKHVWPYVTALLCTLTVFIQHLGLSLTSLTSPVFTKKIGFPVTLSSVKYPGIYKFSTWTFNSTLFYSLLILGFCLLMIAHYFMENTKIVDPYDNPAQLRKLRARGRSFRRQAVGAAVCMALSVLCLTYVKAEATKTPPPPQKGEYTVEDGKVYVNVEDVNDGELHSFQYGSVRWIVIKKPNSAAYGTGLDACDVCGVDKESTYYQRGSQVVCRRCDVVMNINTIGIYGGCNPVPLSYTMEEGKLVFSLDEIMAGESRFAK